jgi:hypothetical protein
VNCRNATALESSVGRVMAGCGSRVTRSSVYSHCSSGQLTLLPVNSVFRLLSDVRLLYCVERERERERERRHNRGTATSQGRCSLT